MGKVELEYVKEKAYWGDLYIIKVYEEQKNTPGFAPETFDTHVCDIWVKYRHWNRRIEFKKCKVENVETLEEIAKQFNAPVDESKFVSETES